MNDISFKHRLIKVFIFIAIKLIELIVCLCVSDRYLLGVQFYLSHTQIGTFFGVHLKFPDEHPLPFYMGVPPPPPDGGTVIVQFAANQGLDYIQQSLSVEDVIHSVDQT